MDIKLYAMGTGNQRLLMAKLTISVTVDAPPWDNVPQSISCFYQPSICHFFFNLCLLRA